MRLLFCNGFVLVIRNVVFGYFFNFEFLSSGMFSNWFLGFLVLSRLLNSCSCCEGIMGVFLF